MGHPKFGYRTRTRWSCGHWRVSGSWYRCLSEVFSSDFSGL